MRKTGNLFVFEGPDGVGKSALVRNVVERFESKGLPCHHIAFPGREEGMLGQHIYALHHDPARFNIKNINPASLQILHIAAHIDTIERQIIPSLQKGHNVILDRYWWSTWVYGKVGGAPVSVLKAMIQVEKEYWGSILPTSLFLIDRKAPLRQDEPPDKFYKLRSTYHDLAQEEVVHHPVHIVLNERSINESMNLIDNLMDEDINNRSTEST